MVKNASPTLDAICDRAELLDAIATVATVVPSNSTKPFLSNIIFTARKGCLEVAGTDLELSIRLRVEATEVLGEGSTLVNAVRALKLMKEFSGKHVQVQADSRSGCVLLTEGAKCHVLGDDVRDYPELPSFDPKDGAVRLNATLLNEMVNRTSFCASKESSAKYTMKGILLELREDKLRLVATDGRRLALAEKKFEGVSGSLTAIVPTKGLIVVKDLLGENEEVVSIAIDGSKVLLHTRKAAVVARRVEGVFPPYEHVVPKGCPIRLDLKREEFYQALRIAALLTTRESQAVKFTFSKKGLEISSRVPEVGESRVNFPLKFPHEKLEIGFNPVYIQDALKQFKSEKFRLELQDDQSPALVKELRAIDGAAKPVPVPGFVYCTMPINVL